MVVIAFGCGVNTSLCPTCWQQPGSGFGGWRSAWRTTTCIGPVVGPTLTRTCVTVPLPAGTNRVCAVVGPTEIVVHVQDWAWVGTSSTAPGTNGDGIGQTEQSKGTF